VEIVYKIQKIGVYLSCFATPLPFQFEFQYEPQSMLCKMSQEYFFAKSWVGESMRAWLRILKFPINYKDINNREGRTRMCLDNVTQTEIYNAENPGSNWIQSAMRKGNEEKGSLVNTI